MGRTSWGFRSMGSLQSHLRESAQESVVDRSVPLVLSKDLGGHSCPGVCLFQEPERHLETGDRAGFLCPVSASSIQKGNTELRPRRL